MDVKEYINSELEGLNRGTARVLDTLTQPEIAWRPACGCNSMGLILFHATKLEDSLIQKTLQDKPRLWESEKWYSKLDMDLNEAGSHYDTDQVNAFPVPDLQKLIDYHQAVRASTTKYLDSLDPDDFNRKVTLPFGEFTVAGIFALIVRHGAQHIGEISYLRGMLRGLDK